MLHSLLQITCHLNQIISTLASVTDDRTINSYLTLVTILAAHTAAPDANKQFPIRGERVNRRRVSVRGISRRDRLSDRNLLARKTAGICELFNKGQDSHECQRRTGYAAGKLGSGI